VLFNHGGIEPSLRKRKPSDQSSRNTGQRAALESLGQRRPRNVLQYEEACFTRLLETVNGGNVRMVQRRERACFSLQGFRPSSCNSSGRTTFSATDRFGFVSTAL
jgi:hypothetical protein